MAILIIAFCVPMGGRGRWRRAATGVTYWYSRLPTATRSALADLMRKRATSGAGPGVRSSRELVEHGRWPVPRTFAGRVIGPKEAAVCGDGAVGCGELSECVMVDDERTIPPACSAGVGGVAVRCVACTPRLAVRRFPGGGTGSEPRGRGDGSWRAQMRRRFMIASFPSW